MDLILRKQNSVMSYKHVDVLISIIQHLNVIPFVQRNTL